MAVHVIRTEGVRGLYRGFVSNATRNTPGEMVFFATYEQARHFVKRSGQVKDDIGTTSLLYACRRSQVVGRVISGVYDCVCVGGADRAC